MTEPILLLSKTEEIKTAFPAKIAERILTKSIERYEIQDSYLLFSFDWVDLKKPRLKSERIMIIFCAETLQFVCDGQRALNMVNQILQYPSDSASGLYLFFSELTKKDRSNLDQIESEISKLEDELLTSSHTEYAQIIISQKKALLKIRTYYEQLNTVFEEVMENENKLISDELLRRFEILDHRVDQIYSKCLLLRDYLTQVREAYQAQIDIEQNALMKFFTVITSIFLPLTLIVGWYGMNLKMPEFEWKLGYLFVIGLAVATAMTLILYFKKKKWF